MSMMILHPSLRRSPLTFKDAVDEVVAPGAVTQPRVVPQRAFPLHADLLQNPRRGVVVDVARLITRCRSVHEIGDVGIGVVLVHGAPVILDEVAQQQAVGEERRPCHGASTVTASCSPSPSTPSCRRWPALR